MRANRLIDILTTLQARGRVTARELAAETGVDVRTIYRDIDALAATGVPVYSERGPEGGYRLLDGYKVRLNGVTEGEAQALFLAGLPGPAADLGLGALIASAERKLTVALPEGLRASGDFIRSRFHFDAPGWYTEADQPPFLRAVVDAVMQSRRLSMRYRSWKGERERLADPLGLVLKGGQWYMAARVEGSVRIYRVSRILSLAATGEGFERPAGFDLAGYWQEATQRMEIDTHPLTMRLKVTHTGLSLLRHVSTSYMASRIREEGEPDGDGWQVVSVPGESLWAAASLVMRLGPDAEVLEPPELRARIIGWLDRLQALYARPG